MMVSSYTLVYYADALWTCGIIQVLYQSDQFLDKNKDYVVAEHQELLSASKCSFISGLFPPPPEETSKSSKFSSIGARFKVSSTFFFLHAFFSPSRYYSLFTSMFFFLPMLQQQLQALMDTLNSTEPHYIRCVKPNNVLKPAIFENVNVMQQLRCGVSDLGKLGDYVLCIWQKTAWLYLMQSVIRVCLRPSGSVVPGTRRAARSTSFCIVSEYLRLRPSKGSKSATELVLILYFFSQ